jgi:hypothetical protein
MKKKSRKIKRRKQSTAAIEALHEAENQRLLSEISEGGMAESAAFRAKQAEEKAKELLTLDDPLELTVGNEVLPPEIEDPKEDEFYEIRETLKSGVDSINFDASCARMELLKSLDCLAMGVDAAESIDAKNSWEKMVAHQAAVCHTMSMSLLVQANERSYKQYSYFADQKIVVDMQSKQINSGIRLMNTFNRTLQTLLKLRADGKQIIDPALKTNLVVAAVQKLMNENETWKSSASELLEILEIYVSEKVQRSKEWPKRANVLSRKLKLAASVLRTVGIEVTTGIKEGNGKRKIVITKNSAFCATLTENSLI